MNNYDALEKLNELRLRGIISNEEFESEKKKLLEGAFYNTSQDGLIWGMPPNLYCMLMHLGPVFLPGGFLLPIIMWVINKDQYPLVDQHGKIILNWLISAAIYALVSRVLVVVLVGYALLPMVGLLVIVFGIIGAVKANRGEIWEYPLTIKFFS